jgi:ribosomal-protein-alanine N-acetyltransferase|tara:strand:- start:116 stop:568 length:453 start_codon:yes stop_codon:yes gene_type:complete
MNNTHINFAKKKDLDDITKIESNCHLSPWTRMNFIDSYEAKNLFKVLRNENDIIGYYIALFATDECQLLNITVKPELQKNGFGQLMLKSLFADCRKAHMSNIFLEVRKSNLLAIRLYEKNGFNEIGIRNNYYKNKGKDTNEDAILMGLAL